MNKKLTAKEKAFCERYILDWNATQSAIHAGYSKKTAGVIGYENLKKPHIQEYIADIQKDIEKISGISKLKVINELHKMAFTSIADLHDTWITHNELFANQDIYLTPTVIKSIGEVIALVLGSLGV